jgi:DNA-binding transcriptional LysR family regulator
MELRHLRYLEAVADAKTFIAAAAKVRVAQPALSRQIRDLEEELGVDLFTREASGSRLTVAGEAVVAIARSMLHSVDEAVRRARLAENGLVGECVVGVGRFPAAYELCARLIARTRQEFSGIQIVVQHLTPNAVWEKLSSAEIDVGIGIAPPEQRPDLATQTFGHDVLDRAALAESHALASRPSVKLDDLKGETYIGVGPNVGSEPIRLLYQEFMAKRFEPAMTRNAKNFENLRFLVRAGAGWSVYPRSVREGIDAGIAVVPITDLAVPFRYVVMSRRVETREVVRCALGILRRESLAEPVEPDANGTETPSGEVTGDPHARASRVELRHLRYLVAVVEHESIGRAAEALGLAQPTLSKALKDLETDVGAVLLTRTPRGVAPTGAGDSFARDARRIIAAADRLASEAQRAVRGASGRVVVGVAPSAPFWDLVSTATALLAPTADPMDIVVDEVPTPHQVAHLREARIDIALGHHFPTAPELEPSVVRVQLVPDSLDVALLPSSHPRAGATELALTDLGDLPFLFMKREFNPGFYDLVMTTMARAQFVPRLEGSYDAIPSIWALVAQGVGWGLGSRAQIASTPRGIAAVPLKDFALPWGIELMYRRAEARPAVLELLAAIRRAGEAVKTAAMTSKGRKYWPAVGRAG